MEGKYKQCKKCGETKSYEEFRKRMGMRDGRVNACRECEREYTRQWYKANPERGRETSHKYRKSHREKVLRYNRKYREANHEKLLESGRQWYKANSGKKCEYAKKYREANPEHARKYQEAHLKERREYSRRYCEVNREKLREHSRQYYEVNRERRREYSRQYYKTNSEKRYQHTRQWLKNHPEKVHEYNCRHRNSTKERLSESMSASVYRSLKGNKNGLRWETIVDYTVEQLRKHLEKQFRSGMTWDNYGTWHIDHIIPINVFNFEKPEDLDFKRCWGLKNLQPLWAKENISKGAKISKPFQPSLTL